MTGTTFTPLKTNVGSLRMTGGANIPQQRRQVFARRDRLPGNVAVALLRVRPLDQGVNPFDFRDVKDAVEIARRITPIVVPVPVVETPALVVTPSPTEAPTAVVTTPTPPVVTATALTLNPAVLFGAEITMIINPAGTEVSLQDGVGPTNRIFLSAFSSPTTFDYTNSDAFIVPDFTAVSPAAASFVNAPSGTGFRIVSRRNSDGVFFVINATFTTTALGITVTVSSAFNCGTVVTDCP